VPWNTATDGSIVFSGSFGNHKLMIDRTIPTNTKSVWLRARTRGLISVYQRIEFVVCPAAGGSAITVPSESLPKQRDITGGSEITLS
jgi:hypothetical protein